jgi:hypothetical protein
MDDDREDFSRRHEDYLDWLENRNRRSVPVADLVYAALALTAAFASVYAGARRGK